MGKYCSSSEHNFCLPVILCVNNSNYPTQALIDSGAEQNLISRSLVDKLHISTAALNPTMAVAALTGQTISSISCKTNKIEFVVSGNHRERGEFFIFDSLKPQIILGFPWLKKHNPIINWSDGRVE